MKTKKQLIVAFGTFDGLHEGHRHFLREAKKLGGELVVVVAHDDAVRMFKKREPRTRARERVAALRAATLADEVLVGDSEQGSWNVFKALSPDVIAIGYDQKELREALQAIQKEHGFSLADISHLELLDECAS